ncbi:M20/M25/M40 family metallo-hydrolase [Haloparvum sedimenti]|uniref:M20/M25/M40 family metallo-hydrolase n=1 Tax=Haloparvum sedimenti TaxID=1678448 RepID=UPI00071E9315|nr:M20/M25/M40 family metallo-hydrolase [Haloparvum sedimenti]
MPTDDELQKAVSDAIDARLDDYRASLFELLRQPSVSTTGEGMAEAADLVAATLTDCGFETELIDTERYPLAYAERVPESVREGETDLADVPTVVFYGHYDVQPPGEEDAWDSPAFEPTVSDGRIYARGVGDNKGQFLAHAFAVDALAAADAFPEVAVKLLVEGGEESGSAGLVEYLEAGAPEIADADLLYVADGPQHAVGPTGEADGAGTAGSREGKPTLIYGNRGVLAFQLDCRTANTDLHSGNFGGPVPAATNRLVQALSSMRGPDGDEITVEGFHEGADVTAADRELVAAIPDDSAAIAADLDVQRFDGDGTYYERLLTEPTMTVNGLSGGYQGEGMKTVLPATASAKLDCRLVPGQDPHAVFEAIESHLAERFPELEATKQSTFPPMKTPVDTPAAPPVAAALEEVYGEAPVELPVLGGSLPAALFRTVEELADVPVLVVPYGDHDQGNHSPNEHMSLDRFEKGIRTSAAVVRELDGGF